MVKNLKSLSQLDMGGVIKHVHDEAGASLRVSQANSEVPPGFSKVVLTSNASGSVTEAVFYAGTSAEKTRVKVTADTAGSLNNRCFLLNNSEDDPKFYVWFNVDSGGTDPDVADSCGIEVPISANDPISIVQLALQRIVDCSEYFEARACGNDLVLIENIACGQTTNSADVDTGFTISTLTEGVTKRIKCITLPEDSTLKYVFNHAEGKFELFNTDINVTVSDSDPKDTPFVINTAAPASGTEYSFVLPINTKSYEMRLRGGAATVQYTFTSGQTSTNYLTMVAGTVEIDENLKLSAATTVYFEVSKPGRTLEVKYWT